MRLPLLVFFSLKILLQMLIASGPLTLTVAMAELPIPVAIAHIVSFVFIIKSPVPKHRRYCITKTKIYLYRFIPSKAASE